jgi:hypothetical protein
MLVAFALVTGVHSLFFNLEPGGEQCFSLAVNKAHSFGGAYLVSGRGQEFVIVRVFSPSNKVLFNSTPKTTSGEFKLIGQEDGLYKLCFRPLDGSSKTVSFEFEHKWDKLDDADYATETTLIDLGSTTRELFSNLNTIARNIHFSTRRERTHRDIAEQTCDRVAWSGMVKMSVLAAITLAQIALLRRLFDNKTVTPV